MNSHLVVAGLLSLGLLLACCNNAAPPSVGQKSVEVETPEKKAADLMRRAEQGDAKAQFNLGVMYDTGEGMPKDAAKAVEWWQKAAVQGLAEAQFNLGVMYAKGELVPKFSAKAFEWFQKAAVQGLAEAQSNLGVMYANGDGVRKDNVLAYAWSNLAASRGDEKSAELRGSIENEMSSNEIAEAQRLSSKWEKGQILTREAGTASPRSSPVAQSGKPWQVEGNWNRVRYGMSESQVISILGRPTRVESIFSLRTLFYKGEVEGSGIVNGNVKLHDDRVYLVNKPIF